MFAEIIIKYTMLSNKLQQVYSDHYEIFNCKLSVLMQQIPQPQR